MAHNDEVKLHFLDYWRVIRIRWVLVLLAFLLVLITAAIFTYFQPREFQAGVFVEVKSTAENPRIFGQGDPNQPIHDPQLAPTVYQVIQRTGILYPVIEQLGLQDKWARDGRRPSRELTYQMLRNKLDVDEVRSTDVLQISVFDSNPQLTAEIATKVATLSNRLEQIQNLKGDDLMRMLPTLDVTDPTVQKILPNYQDTVAQEALLLNSGLAENHPKVKSVRAARQVYTHQLEQQVG